MDLTYIMPCRIESEDRLKNIITSVSYLLKTFPKAKVIVKEVDTRSTFKFRALPEIKKYVNTDMLTHIFEESGDKFFHKTRILNDLLVASDTGVVYNYDVDVVLPKSSYETAYNLIKSDRLDAVYPFGCGAYVWCVNYPAPAFNQFLDSNFDFSVLDEYKFKLPSTIGWGQMLKRDVEIEVGLWNENFLSWGAEDCEFYYRLNALGFKVGRVNDVIYHFEHGRTFNSHYNNPKFMDNHNYWQWLRNQYRETISKHMREQDYFVRRLTDAGI